MAKRLPDISQKVVADGSQYASEMNRIDNVTRRTAAAVDKETAKIAKAIGRKFTAASIGKDILTGFGVGSGFQVINTGIDYFVSKWKESEVYAKEVDDRAKSIAEQFRSLSALKFENMIGGLGGPEQIAARKKQIEDLTAKMVEQARLREQGLKGIADATGAGRGALVSGVDPSKFGGRDLVSAREFADVMLTQAEDASKAWAQFAKEREEMIQRVKVLEAEAAKERDKLNDAEIDAEMKRTVEFQAELQKRADAEGRMLLEENQAQNEAIEKARKADLDLWEDLAKSRIKTLRDEIESANKIFMEAEEKKRDAAIKAAEEIADAHKRMQERVSGDLADMMIGAQSASEVFKQLARDILRVIIQKQITDQIAGSIMGSGIFKGAAKILGFADGGPPPVGVPSLVGEDGPELFVPKSAGTIVPAGRTSQMMAGGGVTVTQSFAFQSGVTRQELSAVLPQLVQASKSAVLDAVQRGGGYRRAFA